MPFVWVYCHANMEGQENQSSPVVQEVPAPVGSFNQKPKKSANVWVFVFLGLLVLGGAGIFFFASKGSNNEPTPTPSFGVIPVDEYTPKPLATSTPEAVEKADVTVQVLNGTGITGEAGYLQNKLKALGFEKIEVGNADSTDYTDTTVTFKKDLSSSLQEEVKEELEKVYKKVVVKTSSTQSSDIVIITGTREGQTAKSSSTPSSSPKSTSTPTGSASPSPTSSPTD